MSGVASLWLVVRALFWTIVLPGFFAFYVPWRFFGVANVALNPRRPLQLLGLVLVATGSVLLAICISDFARRGRGTLSPLDPPRRLVVQGLYRHVRNPMYLSVTLVVFGEVLLTRSAELLTYWAIWFACVNLFVIAYEEPTLRRDFGAEYDAYTRAVPRWLPRLQARSTERQ